MVFGQYAEKSQCTYRCVVLPDEKINAKETRDMLGLNAPTGAWCSLTFHCEGGRPRPGVSMHLQVRGAP